MNFDTLSQRSYSRRSFLKQTAAAGIGITGVSGAAILTGCGGTSSNPQTSTVTITVSDGPSPNDTTNYPVFKAAVDQFQKDNPRMKVVGHPYAYEPDTFFARLAAGEQETATRVFFTEPQGMINHHLIADVTDYVRKWQYFSSIAPSALAVASDSSGRIYGLPQDGYKDTMLYSRARFKQAGLDPDKPPKTWDEFLSAAKAVSTGGKYAYMELTGVTPNEGGWMWTHWLFADGGRPEQYVNGGYKAIFNNKDGLDALNIYWQMRWIDKTMVPRATVSQDDRGAYFGAGRTAFIIGGNSDLAGYRNTYGTPVDQFGVGPMPVKDLNNPNTGTLGGGDMIIFRKDSTADQLDGAVRFMIAWRLAPSAYEAQIRANAAGNKYVGWDDNAAFIGTYKDILLNIVKKYANVPLQYSQPYFDAKQAVIAEPPAKAQAYYGKLDSVVQSVLTDQSKTPQQLLDAAAQDFQNTLDQSN